MGTDINVAVKILIKKKWQTVTCEIKDNRSYTTFSVLANVRSTGNDFIKLPRGFPDDFEPELYIEQLALDSHSQSYFTLLELLETNVSFEGTYLDEWLEVLLELKKKYKVPLSSVKVIFWFDS